MGPGLAPVLDREKAYLFSWFIALKLVVVLGLDVNSL